MTPLKNLPFACALLMLPAFLACGGGGSSQPQPTVAVTLTPTAASLIGGATRTFVATVSGSSNTNVTWTVQEGSAGGTVSAAGLYTAPATAGTYHVVATSAADTSKSANAAVTVSAEATTLTYTDPASGSYKLVKNAASAGRHLVLDLIGPSSGTAMGISITLTGDAHTAWVDIPAGGTTSALMLNGTQFSLGAGTPIQKAKATGNVLQATVAQKAPTPTEASLNGVLLQVALDLKSGQSLAPETTLTLTADSNKCQLLGGGTGAVGTGTISPISVSVGTLKAQ